VAEVLLAVCLGPGGIPKQPVDSARVTLDGLEGDAHDQSYHGGRKRAVCLLSIEQYRALRADGVACETPGTFGENLLIEGLDPSLLRPGDRLRIGDQVLLELHDVRAPCATLRSIDGRFPDLMVGRSGWMCAVLEEGTLRPGMAVTRLAGADHQ
jgi:MOSC domain-containing protein YiiM